MFFVKLKNIKIYSSSFIRHSKLPHSDRAYKSVYFCCLFPFFKNINEVVANIISTKIANCFSSTIATTRIAAAHMIELEINNLLLILFRHPYLLHRDLLVLNSDLIYLSFSTSSKIMCSIRKGRAYNTLDYTSSLATWNIHKK